MMTLVWFGSDLRLADNPALDAAVADGRAVVPFYVLDDADAGEWAPGGASRWWLHGSLASLASTLSTRGSRLILRCGPAEAAIGKLLADTGADTVYWNRRYEPWATTRDERLKAHLKRNGVEVRSFILAPISFPDGDDLSSWALSPKSPDWAGGIRAAWTPGEDGARARLDAFVDGTVLDYREKRNLPGVSGTSRLSPHLHFGEIGPRQIWHATVSRALADTGNPMPQGVETYLSEIAWREFSYHLLFHFPTLPEQPLRTEFTNFPWAEDAKGLAAWRRGLTGYPIVDAGMRELWSTGWMHNRVRMIVASFLIKDLLLHWRHGEAWFWDTLVDADLASNAASWQWVAGCGADAAPYFRVFNPSLQGGKFDPDGAYVRRWVPELSKMPDGMLHAPWDAPLIALADAGVELGRTYPLPIVDHAIARQRALDAYQRLKKG
jgi:deoxyribodipyrimidine photo-lyase